MACTYDMYRRLPQRAIVTEGDLAGIPLWRLTYPLHMGDGQVHDPVARFYARHADYVDEYLWKGGTPQQWWDKGGWRDVSYEMLAEVFTPDELTRLWWKSGVQDPLDDYFHDRDGEHPIEHVLWKVRHSLWMWGWSDKYDHFVRCYEGLRRLSFGDGFEVRLDHTLTINERGTGVHTWNQPPKSVWLDGEFGLIVYHKQKHVLTVGFSFTKAGVLIHQVQLREKKGNRFLFKLPEPYLEHTITCFQTAFPDLQILLIEGTAAVENVRKSYGSKVADFDAKNVADHIRSFYDRPLRGFTRGPRPEQGVYVACRPVIRALAA